MALVGAAAALSFGCSMGLARAADDGYENVFTSVLKTVGVLTPDADPDIEYRERPALVLPPKMTLDKPAAEAARGASWPQDPDVLARRRAEAEAHTPLANVLGNRNLLASRADMDRGRVASGADSGQSESVQRNQRCGNKGNQRNCLVVNPDELKAENDRYIASGQGEKKDLQPGDEPERLYLTQPPKGYLRVTKTVKATTEAPQQKLDEARPSTALVYHEKNDDE